MTTEFKPWGPAILAVLMIGGAFTIQEPAPKERFEPFGREAAVREMIAEGFKAATKEVMGPEDLARATDEVLANFRGLPQAVGKRWGEGFLHRKKIGELTRGYAVLQLRSGAGGGNPNQVRLDGRTSIYVDSISATPLNLGGAVSINERSTAYFQAGYVPRGKVFVIKTVEYWGTAKGDSNGHGEFLIRIPGVQVERVSDTETVPRKKWKGRVVVRPGLEDQVQFEIANSSQGEAIFRGLLVDEKYADGTLPFPFSPEDKLRADKNLVDLEADLIEKREAAAKAIVEIGPGVIEYLKAKNLKTPSAELKGRIASILEQFGEDP